MDCPLLAPDELYLPPDSLRERLNRVIKEREPFRYFDKGNLATIGRNRAVADFGRLQVSGWVAWWLWLFVHILYLAGFRNRASVLLEWGYSFLTYLRGSRLITWKECE